MYIRNFGAAQNQVRTHAIKQAMTGLIRQYGIDELLKGLSVTYNETVFAKAKSSEPVQHRAAVLAVAVEQLDKKEVSL